MDEFVNRHIGVSSTECEQMLAVLGYDDLDLFIQAVIPTNLNPQLKDCVKDGLSEQQALDQLKTIMQQNKVYKNFIGWGYHDTITPAVIKRNVFNNPAWYTAYTPYQAEISQGRLEALLNFQQMIVDLTKFDLANASLLDEATAAAEAMTMSYRINPTTNKFLLDCKVLTSTISVMQTRAKYLGIELIIADVATCNPNDYCGILVQNPNLHGIMYDYSSLFIQFKQLNPQLLITCACDILSLAIFKAPATMGADIAIGSTQRFGIPIGFGGPAAAYIATKDIYKRLIPGRIIGVTVDSKGNKALRMSLQTREQHIRREKATSNICTSQVLLANMAGFYAVYHGAQGLKNIAWRINNLAQILAANLSSSGIELSSGVIFDTLSFFLEDKTLIEQLLIQGYLLGYHAKYCYISIGESATLTDIEIIFNTIVPTGIFNASIDLSQHLIPQDYLRQDQILTHAVFNTHHSETQMMRYLKYLENKDISLVNAMIPLGSCTMKLNSAASLEPLSWETVANIHPFNPDCNGYLQLTQSLSNQLKLITGFDTISLQPNSGAQGEYAGLLTIRRYQAAKGEAVRNICLIPRSAHGTNPASAQMMGMEVVVVACDAQGNIELNDLTTKAELYQERLSCLMITYPSTHGVFETKIKQICQTIHDYGGQVYMDGANLNALVGLLRPSDFGVDVSHINLHKTFAIPHGGGGPGMGPIGVKAHLSNYLPGNPIFGDNSSTAVSSWIFGSASILTISWMYNTMLGMYGLRQATKYAILNANYIAYKLNEIGYQLLYSGQNNLVAHECIIDLRAIKLDTGINEVDFAKRLIDYCFHAPTISFPVAGTLMIEPTESEDKIEIDRFIVAMAKIYQEVQLVKEGIWDKIDNPLKNAPHTLADIIVWDKPYTVAQGCFPLDSLKKNKIFASINRIDEVYGDRNFLCSCFDFN